MQNPNNGWTFEYDPETLYIGGKHECGGRVSILEMKRNLLLGKAERDTLGRVIANLMNDMTLEGSL